MPRIVPIQLLKCLRVLLNVNGGILSTGEVKRIATLMSKYSKKLVSKCIYVQILKCTDTELLDEFMAVGGWNLVHGWLTDGIRLMNWPLVQEILELLLLCPVDVNRLKLNSAPKMVKTLCHGSNEGVCILANRLVDQWLKIVTEGNEQQQLLQQQQRLLQQQQQEMQANQQPVQPKSISSTSISRKVDSPTTIENATAVPPPKLLTKAEPSSDVDDDEEDNVDEDPLAIPSEPVVPKELPPTTAQKKASKAGLVYKIVVRNGQQLLTKVESKSSEDVDESSPDVAAAEELNEEENDGIIVEDEDTAADLIEEDSTSLDKTEDKEESSGDGSSNEDQKIDDKKPLEVKEKTDKTDSKDERIEREERKSKDVKTKEPKIEKDKERRSSSSSHRSSSSSKHKSSSKSSTSTSSSSSSKTKSSSSSSASAPSSSSRSSSDKHRNDKDRASSSKDKDKDRNSSSSSSSKHKSSSSSSKTSSSSSSSKERHREKDKDKAISLSTVPSSSSSSASSSSSSKRDKEREKELQAEKDRDTISKMVPPSLDKLGKIPKKPKDKIELDTTSSDNNTSSAKKSKDKIELDTSSSDNNTSSANSKPTSITIPSKKASMSIEIRRDTEKSNTVKTYKSQFRSHGLNEEAPPPPSRKSMKKPGSLSASQTSSSSSSVIPTSLPSSSLKRPSPPPRETSSEKKSKIDINQITPAAANIEKPGAIKLIPAKRIQTLVETNIFSDALAAATGPKKVAKRKRPANAHKDDPGTPTSPDASKVAPLKFYQDTLDESSKAANDDKSDKSKDDSNTTTDADKDNANITDEDDDIPLKKVKEDIEQRVRMEKAAAAEEKESIAVAVEGADDKADTEDATSAVEEVRKPGPGCGPDGPPGVLMLHRRRGPKKKLSWRPQETLEQIRYFELDENERVNVMKVSFHDMKNMERFNERASLTNLTKRGPRPGDNQEPRTEWRPLIEVDEVPVHPDGAQSKERRVQADREMTTLRALYFSPNMIPDTPSEAEIEPHYPGDPPIIPLDDITGNQDTVNDFSGMPWPEPKGSPRHGDDAFSGTGGLGSVDNPAAEMFPRILPNNQANAKIPFGNKNFVGPFPGNAASNANNMPPGTQQIPPMPPMGWQGPPKNSPLPMINSAFSLHPDMRSGGPNFMPPRSQFNGPPPHMQNHNSGPFGPPPPGFNVHNFNQMAPGNPMGPMTQMGPMNQMGPMGNHIGPGPIMGVMNNGPRGNNNGRNWVNGPNNFKDKNMNNANWRPAGSGPNRTGNNNGVCKAFMRGNCRLSKCKYIHPKKRL